MKEKEKMLTGEFYDTRDSEILEMRYRARHLMDEFNNLPADAIEERNSVLNELLGDYGKGVWIEKPFRCNYGENISIGENTFINCNCMFSDDNKVTIGKNVMIAPGVQIYSVTHPVKASERIKGAEAKGLPFNTYTKPVHIGDNSWIGGNSIILPGITIGKNVVVGAGSVVTKDIPDNCLAVGNPCKVIRENIE